jgi:hypothetical protein
MANRKESDARYNRSVKGRERQYRYNHSKKGKARWYNYYQRRENDPTIVGYLKSRGKTFPVTKGSQFRRKEAYRKVVHHRKLADERDLATLAMLEKENPGLMKEVDKLLKAAVKKVTVSTL